MKRTLSNFILWVTLVAAFSVQVVAQDELESGHVILDANEFRDGGTIVLGNEPWRYRSGDDPAWADPSLDDSSWVLLKPDFDPDSLATEIWNGIGWFRLRLSVEPELRNTTISLSFFHLGASEVYLDGEKVGGFGVIGNSAEREQPFSPKGFPIALHLDDKGEHLLAVQYAYRNRDTYAARWVGKHPYHPQGFFILVKQVNAGFRSFFYRTLEVPFTLGLIIGISLLLSAMHLMLYGFDRKERANLYFGIQALAGVVAIYLNGAWDSVGLIVPNIGSYLWLAQISTAIMLIGIVAVYYQVFYQRLLKGFWLFVAAGILITFLPKLVQSAAQMTPLVILEGIRVTSIAIRKKKNGGWILGTGILVLLLAVVSILLIRGQFISAGQSNLLEAAETLRVWSPLSLAIIVFYMAFPISMSVLLARRFSQTSRRLQGELAKVQELSERALQQEREKQALIATQKERLETEVTERTAELKRSLADLKATQAQLVQQEKLASLGQLTAGIAHEIKNPLNFVNNFAELSNELTDELRDTIAKGEPVENVLGDLEQNVKLIAQHGKRADNIVKNMMAHASGGKGERVPTDINALVEEYVGLAYHGMRAKKPDFNVDIEKDLADISNKVELVPQEIGRVLLNLLGNAFDAVYELTGLGQAPYEPKVIVSTRKVGDVVEIRVSDNGGGIPDDVREKIFEPFFTTKPAGSGTGLGLSLSYDIVTQGHGGTLKVESQKGKGATFVVTLPG